MFLSIFATGMQLVFSWLPTVSASPDWFVNYALPTFQVLGALIEMPIINTVISIFLIYLAVISGWQLVPLYGWLYTKVRGAR